MLVLQHARSKKPVLSVQYGVVGNGPKHSIKSQGCHIRAVGVFYTLGKGITDITFLLVRKEKFDLRRTILCIIIMRVQAAVVTGAHHSLH